jgi:hypothetical protein
MALAAPRAGAQSFTGQLDPLAQDVAERKAALSGRLTKDEAKQRMDLGRALRALARPSTSAVRDLAIARKVSKILDKAFPGDGVFGPDLDGALDGFRSIHHAGRDRLEAFVGTLADGSLEKALGLAGIDAVDALISVADLAPTRAARAAYIGKALRKLGSAWTAALGATWLSIAFGFLSPRRGDVQAGSVDVTTDIDTDSFSSQATLGVYNPGTGQFRLEALEVLDPVADRARSLGLVVSGVTGPGTYPLLGAGMTEFRSSSDHQVFYGVAETFSVPGIKTGTFTLTVLDPERGLAEGTFSFAFLPVGGAPAATQGRFRVGVRITRSMLVSPVCCAGDI